MVMARRASEEGEPWTPSPHSPTPRPTCGQASWPTLWRRWRRSGRGGAAASSRRVATRWPDGWAAGRVSWPRGSAARTRRIRPAALLPARTTDDEIDDDDQAVRLLLLPAVPDEG